MELRDKKFIVIFLVFSLLSLSANLFAKERKGAEIIIEKKDGKQVRGELIAVKDSSLLLLGSESGADVSVGIRGIKTIKIPKKSKFWIGAGLGLLAGFAFGLVASPKERSFATLGQELEISFISVIVAPIAGGIGGAMAGADEIIKIEENLFEEKPRVEVKMVNGKLQRKVLESKLEKIIKKLRSKARIPDYK